VYLQYVFKYNVKKHFKKMKRVIIKIEGLVISAKRTFISEAVIVLNAIYR